MKTPLTYLVCPLNWGLGHASRMIPVVYDLLQQGHHVILGGDGDALMLLSKEFPELQTLHIQDIKVKLGHHKMLWNILGLVPKIMYSAIREHYLLKRLLKTADIDVVISDNRYGLRNKKIKSVLVTHQLMVKLPKPIKVLEYPVHLLIKTISTKFDECWIPDYADKQNSLSGDLSHKYKAPYNTVFIGPLSRFDLVRAAVVDSMYEVVVVLSGPEPLRSHLERELREVLSATQIPILIVQGKPSEKIKYTTEGKVSTVSHLSTWELSGVLHKATTIICRSGYSSLMDLEHFKAKVILIPTPGQTEQEYLARHLNHRYVAVKQADIVLRLPALLQASI